MKVHQGEERHTRAAGAVQAVVCSEICVLPIVGDFDTHMTRAGLRVLASVDASIDVSISIYFHRAACANLVAVGDDASPVDMLLGTVSHRSNRGRFLGPSLTKWVA